MPFDWRKHVAMMASLAAEIRFQAGRLAAAGAPDARRPSR